jgi:hypothetical protein
VLKNAEKEKEAEEEEEEEVALGKTSRCPYRAFGRH